jgi:long-chain acyl-CoA synthetase
MTDIRRIFDLLELQKKYDKTVSLAGKLTGEWIKYSSRDYIENTNNISYALLKLGVKKGDKIGLIASNCPEWNFIDMGIMQTGAITIPIYPNINENEYDYIFNHCEAEYLFIEDESLYFKLKNAIKTSHHIKDVFSINKIADVKHISLIYEIGKENTDIEKLKKAKESVSANDIATIIYTSGTTGIPKGVVLSHANLVSNFVVSGPLTQQNENSVVLSFLPLCHVYERMLNYAWQLQGCSIFYVQSIGTIVDNILEVKPHSFSTVPRLLEKVYDRILFKGRNLSLVKKTIFFWAVDLGLKYNLHHENGWWYHFKLKIADILIFSKWREALGGNIYVIVSGGAALQERIARVFWAANMRVLEGYGLSETSPLLTVNNFNPDSIKFGTVGPVIEGVEVKIAEDGEILSRGPNTMLGYYKEPEITKQVLDSDGWFHTGDLGMFVDEKFLKITGRKKSLFKTSMGKYVSPELIEATVRESNFIEQIVVFGENQKFVGALIVPDFQYLHNWANIKGIGYIDDITAVNHPKIKARFAKEIDRYNNMFSPHEQIKKFELISDIWTIQTGEYTPSMKLKRTFIEKKYSDKIQKLFK